MKKKYYHFRLYDKITNKLVVNNENVFYEDIEKMIDIFYNNEYLYKWHYYKIDEA